jgi:hypothetical protein
VFHPVVPRYSSARCQLVRSRARKVSTFSSSDSAHRLVRRAGS